MATDRLSIRVALLLAATTWWCVWAPFSAAQIKQTEQSEVGVRYGEPRVSHYRVGVKVTAKRGGVQKIRAMVAVPLACDEQQVTIVEEDISPQVGKLAYRDLASGASGGARQMLVTIPLLPAGEEAHAILKYEVRIRPILPPEQTDGFLIPKKPDRNIRRYLGRSPYIEVGHRKIRAAVKQAWAKLDAPPELPISAEQDGSTGKEDATEPADNSADNPTGSATESHGSPTDWQRVEAIYDYVQETVKYLEGPDKSAVKALRDRQGDCQAISALFVAMCRTGKIPARIVWVHEHSYPEFYLEDATGQGHWFPCESSGMRAFGEMPLTRTILQKGDSFRVPERRGETLRYASDYLLGLPISPGGGKPKVRYIREQL